MSVFSYENISWQNNILNVIFDSKYRCKCYFNVAIYVVNYQIEKKSFHLHNSYMHVLCCVFSGIEKYFYRLVFPISLYMCTCRVLPKSKKKINLCNEFVPQWTFLCIEYVWNSALDTPPSGHPVYNSFNQL